MDQEQTHSLECGCIRGTKNVDMTGGCEYGCTGSDAGAGGVKSAGPRGYKTRESARDAMTDGATFDCLYARVQQIFCALSILFLFIRFIYSLLFSSWCSYSS